jgi:hypothetical protein
MYIDFRRDTIKSIGEKTFQERGREIMECNTVDQIA